MKRFLALVVGALSLFGFVSLVEAAPPPQAVLKTGQTKCWPATGINPPEIPCAGTGQDGELQAGLPRSYTDNGDGTITDNVTGLIWEKLVNQDFVANPGDLHDADNAYNPWTAAFQKIAVLNAANFAGHNDWRLPNVRELRTLVFFGRSFPSIDAAFHDIGANSRTRSATYWTSSTSPSQTFNAWSVGFTTGLTTLTPKTAAANTFCCFVRAVRGPAGAPAVGAAFKTGLTQCWDSSGAEVPCPGTGQDGEFQVGVAQAYSDNADGTITDTVTGLMWEKLGNLDLTANPADLHDVDNVTHTWAQAFQKIADLNAANFAGHNDWRLPNVIELESLAFFGKETSRPPGPNIPAVNEAFDNGTDSFTRSTGYWSSTTGLSLTGQANGVNFLQGNVYFLSKEQPFANGGVRAVRGPVDGAAPTITLTTPPDGATYAQNQVVNADYECQDEPGGSGLASCVGDVASGAPIDTSTLGPHTFTVTATDNAGNTRTVTHHYTVADVTPPTITLTTPPQGASYLLNQVVNADYACQDEAGGSGLASCVGNVASGAPIDTATVGSKTFTVTATDNAGNPASLSHTYSVIYKFSGFLPPVDGLPVLNRMNAGGAAPVKFSLGGYQGLAIFEPGYPRSEWIACDSTALVDGIEQTLTAGASSLSYSPDTDVYTYIWKPEKSWAGTCRQLVIKLKDGTFQRANFRFD